MDPSPAHRDRNLVWTDFSAGALRIVISRSDDRGATWSDARPVDPGKPNAGKQFMPRLAVRADGVIGVSFFDTRESAGGDRVA